MANETCLIEKAVFLSDIMNIPIGYCLANGKAPLLSGSLNGFPQPQLQAESCDVELWEKRHGFTVEQGHDHLFIDGRPSRTGDINLFLK